jgi:hypothetical protein
MILMGFVGKELAVCACARLLMVIKPAVIRLQRMPWILTVSSQRVINNPFFIANPFIFN